MYAQKTIKATLLAAHNPKTVFKSTKIFHIIFLKKIRILYEPLKETKKMKHVMVPYRPDTVFFRAFKNALTIAKQNNSLLSLVKVISYPAGIGMDESLIVDLVSREYDVQEFDKFLPMLQKEADSAKIKMDVHILDLHLSPAKGFVNFVSNHNVDLMVVGSIAKKGWKKYLDSDISDEIMDLNPPCNVILVE